jgi:hypothetical protein
MLERHLVNCCTELWKRNKHSQEPDIPRTGIILATRDYLTTYAGISLSKTSPNWIATVAYNKIRNSIVHNDGKFDQRTLEKLKPFLAFHSSITLSQGNQITLGEDTCKNFIKVIRSLFFDEIFKVGKE